MMCIKYNASVFQYVFIFRMNKVLLYALTILLQYKFGFKANSFM